MRNLVKLTNPGAPNNRLYKITKTGRQVLKLLARNDRVRNS